MVVSAWLRFLNTLVQPIIGRRTRRIQAVREIEQIRQEVDACAAIFVADTEGGVVPLRQLPIDSAVYISRLHADGFLNDDEFTLLRQFFEPVRQANALLTAPPQGGPPMLNEAQRIAYLGQGRGNVQIRDGNGLTLHDRVKAALAEALTRIGRRSL